MVKIKGNTEHRNCASCCINLTKLKQLCKLKGLRTSFTTRPKKCARHQVIIINNYCDCAPASNIHKNLLTSALVSAHKQIIAARRKHKLSRNHIKFDEFLVENESGNISDATIEFEPPVMANSNDIKKVAETPTPKKNKETGELFIKPEVSQSIVFKCAPPNEQDSLGLLNFTEEHTMLPTYEHINAWTKYGFPYIADLPASQYEIPEQKNDKAAYGWSSPQLSPILP